MPVVVGVLLVTVVEVAAFVEVARQIGVLLAVVLVLGVSACGPWLVRRAGFGTWRRAQERLRMGEAPGREILDGVALLAAGVLISVPGFVTDVAGLLLLLPPVRAVARRTALRGLARRLVVGTDDDGRRRGPPVVDARSRANRRRLPRHQEGPPEDVGGNPR